MQKSQDLDVGLLLKLQTKVKELEKDKTRLSERLEHYEEEGSQVSGLHTDSAFDTLKVSGVISQLNILWELGFV